VRLICRVGTPNGSAAISCSVLESKVGDPQFIQLSGRLST
jgi:hypothetical protein